MKIHDAFPSKYLKAADLNNKDITVTIDRWEQEKIGDDKKFVLYFVGKTKGLVLNVTNAKIIEKLTGSDDFDEWVGKPITLYSAEVAFRGDMTDAVRVRSKPVTAKSTAKKETENDDWNDQF